MLCSAVFSACLLHCPPWPCSHAASISLRQSICIPISVLLISFSLPYFSLSWVPRHSHWYATLASATINTGRWLSISVREWNHCTQYCMSSLCAYTTTHPEYPHEEYQTSHQRNSWRRCIRQKITVQHLVEQLVLCDKQNSMYKSVECTVQWNLWLTDTSGTRSFVRYKEVSVTGNV